MDNSQNITCLRLKKTHFLPKLRGGDNRPFWKGVHGWRDAHGDFPPQKRKLICTRAAVFGSKIFAVTLVAWQRDMAEAGCYDTEHFSPRHDFHWHLRREPSGRPLLSFLLTI